MLRFAVELSAKVKSTLSQYLATAPDSFNRFRVELSSRHSLVVMERFNLRYSMKNIPVPSRHEYKKMLVAKTESLIKRMRWKVMAFDGKLQPSGKNTFGFRSPLYPEPSPDLATFEKDLMSMIRNIEFRPVHNEFQTKLRNDISAIKASGKVVVAADKSSNLYKMDKDVYESDLFNSITAAYKKSDQNKVDQINNSAHICAKQLDLDDRMEKMQTSEAFITVKDHKESFNVSPTFRLINPSKTDIGRVSKQLLDGINKKLLLSTKVNQWKNTQSVIDWFSQIRGKRRCTFIQFDIENFYPSITAELFDKAIAFAKQHVDIPDLDLEIIKQARATLLFHQGQPWIKQTDDDGFDVPMGAYDGAEVCELVGSYMLSQVNQVIDNSDVGLYRDDGLGVLRNIGKPEIERRKKKIIQIFKSCGLGITIMTSLQLVQYLDVEFDLRSGQYRPFRKPNSDPLYINSSSNHPASVLNHVPDSIARRLSDISSSSDVFREALPEYENALRNSGFTKKLAYSERAPNQQENKRTRRRKILWYNPPFSISVKTNVGKKFLDLLRLHFHPNHRLRSIFNTKTVKVSYCCMRNVASIISGHNKRILRPTEPVARTCSCRNPDECPLNGRCLESFIIYNGDVSDETDNPARPYIGLTSVPFKDRLGVHNQGINHRSYAGSCELSKHVWTLKDANKNFSIKWGIREKVRGRLIGGECRLCVTEKLHIIEYPDQELLLNSNSDIKCVHQRKYKLASLSAQGRGRAKKRGRNVRVTNGIT